MYSQKIQLKTTTFSVGEVSVVCVAKYQSSYKIQKNAWISRFFRVKGRSDTSTERGNAKAQGAGALDKTLITTERYSWSGLKMFV
jgi:hypothetical protein